MRQPHAAAEILERTPGIRHLFLSRAGGVSRGIYSGLNCGAGSGDDPRSVAENRARAARAVGATPENLRTLHQIHSRDVADADADWPASPPRADALVCTRPGIAIGVLAADCAPVLLADPQARVIAAAHAGWRGALAGVIESALSAMEARGAARARVRAGIGPCIGPDSYEVGPEFPDPFVAQDPANRAFFADAPENGRMLFDLPGYVRSRLERAGVADIAATGHDTYVDDSFFSYRRSRRRNEPDYGRNLSVIVLAEDG